MQASRAVDQELFRKTCSRFATGIAVATVLGREGRPRGLTVNSFTSVSCVPPQVLICIDSRYSYLADFRDSPYFGISILSEAQTSVSVRFADRSSDPFQTVEWFGGVTGVPLLAGSVATLECGLCQVVDSGDHAILIGEVHSAASLNLEPLVYFGSRYRLLAP